MLALQIPEIPGVSGRAAPAGAVAFGVKHTEGVRVDVLFHGHAEPEAVAGSGTRWPLDEGTVLRFSMSRASSEVNDNKVRSGVPGVGLHGGRTSCPNKAFGVRRSRSAFMRMEGSPSTKLGCSSPASVSSESIPGAGAGMGTAKPGLLGLRLWQPSLSPCLGMRRLCPHRNLPGCGCRSGWGGGKEQPQQGTPAPCHPVENPQARWIPSLLSPRGVLGKLGLGTKGTRGHPAGQL